LLVANDESNKVTGTHKKGLADLVKLVTELRPNMSLADMPKE
jgi:hypothetical protein